MDLGEKLKELKDTQEARLKETREFFFEPWECNISVKKIKLNDLVLSEKAAYETLDDGTKRFSEEIRKAVIVLLGIEGLHPLRDKDFIMGEPAGVITSIFKEIMEFSGFGCSVEETLKEKKKD
jgi:hypothetical protein